MTSDLSNLKNFGRKDFFKIVKELRRLNTVFKKMENSQFIDAYFWTIIIC